VVLGMTTGKLPSFSSTTMHRHMSLMRSLVDRLGMRSNSCRLAYYLCVTRVYGVLGMTINCLLSCVHMDSICAMRCEHGLNIRSSLCRKW